MYTFESIAGLGKYSKISPVMKRWHKKNKSRATRAHGKCFVRTWRSFVNPFEDCAFKVALATDLVKIDIVKTMQFLKDSSSQPQPSTWGGRDNIVPSVFAHFYLSSLDCPVELSVLDMKRSEIKKLFTV